VKRYSDVKNVDYRPDRGSVQKMKKEARVILQALEKNSHLSLNSGQVILRKNGLNISCSTIRRRLLAHEISKHSEETATVQKTRCWIAIGTR